MLSKNVRGDHVRVIFICVRRQHHQCRQRHHVWIAILSTHLIMEVSTFYTSAFVLLVLPFQIQYSPDNLTLAYSHIMDNSHNRYSDNCMIPSDSIDFNAYIIPHSA